MAHSHAAAGRRMVPVAVIMTLLGATELVLGLSGQNALILADGSHNLVDAGFTLIGAFVFILSGQTKNHFNNCTLPLLTAAATYAGTLILVSLLAFPEFSELEHLTRGELWLTVALASIAAAANFLTSLLLERGGHHLEHATWLHLMSDVALSAVVIAAALLALIFGDPKWAQLGLVIVVLSLAILGINKTIVVLRDLHRKDNHPEVESQHDDHQDHHHPH